MNAALLLVAAVLWLVLATAIRGRTQTTTQFGYALFLWGSEYAAVALAVCLFLAAVGAF